MIALVAATAALAAPHHFTAHVTNPWFPLRPGTTYVHEGTADGRPVRDVFRVTRRTKVVDGARCVVIDDRVFTNGRLSERTTDYYTQDEDGNVWYFGEDTAEIDAKGRVRSRAGTWRAGVRGARPGLFMPADPKVGEHHFQEQARGRAEDEYRVTRRDATVTVPYGTFHDALVTHEWTPLEPGIKGRKVYARGVGQVLEQAITGEQETLALVRVDKP
jgi:hypothetical protein